MVAKYDARNNFNRRACILNLNHLPMEKLSSMKPIPDAKKVGYCYSKELV